MTLDWLTDWHLTDWLTDNWLIEKLTLDWLTLDWLTDWHMTDWLTGTWMIDWLTLAWLTDWHLPNQAMCLTCCFWFLSYGGRSGFSRRRWRWYGILCRGIKCCRWSRWLIDHWYIGGWRVKGCWWAPYNRLLSWCRWLSLIVSICWVVIFWKYN